jgi:hypothetical protein
MYTTALCGQWIGDSEREKERKRERERERERDTQKVPYDGLVGFRAVSIFQTPASTDSLFQFPERSFLYLRFSFFLENGKQFFINI